MVSTALSRRWIFFVCLIFWAIIFGCQSKPINANQYQQCTTNNICTIGEFLYDDSYTPIAVGASCVLTSRYPNGDVLVNAENMPSTADGWYAYNVATSGLSNGTYRSQMCCITDSDTICLDKTFEIATAVSSIITDVWTTPNRALTSFGELVTNIWDNSSRSLTSNSLGSGTSLATIENIDDIGSSLTIISQQITTIDSKVNALQIGTSNLENTTTNILSKWGEINVAEIIDYIDTLENQLGNNTQNCDDDSVFGNISCLVDKWGENSAETIYTAANNAYTLVNNLRSEIGFSGKSTTVYEDIVLLKSYVDTIKMSIGTASDTSAEESIFGRIKLNKETIETIDTNTTEINTVLNKWGTLSAIDIYDKVKILSNEINEINTVSNVDSITYNYITQKADLADLADLTDLKNQLLAMKALLEVNRIQLEKIDNKPIVKSWLENGSVIFKSLITNPSASVAQEVPFVYYLPTEVKEGDIIKKSANLIIKYDTTKSLLYANGDFKLKPKETLIVEIEVKDIWSVPQEKIETLRRQATELFVPLKETSYFAQGSTLHSDIQASLDRIEEIQKPEKLPEEKIKDFRSAQIELESVNKKIDSLKEIVTSAGSIGTLSGFIGGVSTIGSWGIIVVLLAGFAFLAIYFKSLNTYKRKVVTETGIKTQKSSKKITLVVVAFGLSFISSAVLIKNYLTRKEDKNESIGPMVLSAASEHTPVPNLIPTNEPKPTLYPSNLTPKLTPAVMVSPTITKTASVSAKSMIIVPDRDMVFIYSKPSTTADIIYKLSESREVDILAETKLWVKIILLKNKLEGWVNRDFIQKYY